jgi:hypothetical protein
MCPLTISDADCLTFAHYNQNGTALTKLLALLRALIRFCASANSAVLLVDACALRFGTVIKRTGTLPLLVRLLTQELQHWEVQCENNEGVITGFQSPDGGCDSLMLFAGWLIHRSLRTRNLGDVFSCTNCTETLEEETIPGIILLQVPDHWVNNIG